MALVVSSLGCGAETEDVNPVTGKITYDGKPLGDARIRLQAVDGGTSRVYACDSKADGTFEIEAVFSTETKKGAPLGKYKVMIGKFEKYEHADPDIGVFQKTVINKKFNSASTTPLELEVVEGKNVFRIDLKSDPKLSKSISQTISKGAASISFVSNSEAVFFEFWIIFSKKLYKSGRFREGLDKN